MGRRGLGITIIILAASATHQGHPAYSVQLSIRGVHHKHGSRLFSAVHGAVVCLLESAGKQNLAGKDVTEHTEVVARSRPRNSSAAFKVRGTES